MAPNHIRNSEPCGRYQSQAHHDPRKRHDDVGKTKRTRPVWLDITNEQRRHPSTASSNNNPRRRQRDPRRQSHTTCRRPLHLQRPPATTSISTELRGNDQRQQHHDERQDRAAGGDVPVSSATKRQAMGTHHFQTVTKDDDRPNTQTTDSNSEQSQFTMTKSQNRK